jgi:formylglycine-generating enzyme required for sulfatase activity
MLRLNKSCPSAIPILVSVATIVTLAFAQEESSSTQEVVLIPGGEFLMGVEGEGDAGPAHAVQLDSFYMEKCEVTNAQYAKFCEETAKEMPLFWGMERFHCGPGFPNHPVVGVTWRDAKAYAEWKGMRLPTEAEWEYAARGGLEGKKFPDGDDLDSSTANCWPSSGTEPVGIYPPNGYGLHDMAGNVVEWVHDYYDKDYYSASPSKNPQGPEDGKFQVIRGGGWHSGRSCNTVYYRNCLKSSWIDFNVGFRCVKDVR